MTVKSSRNTRSHWLHALFIICFFCLNAQSSQASTSHELVWHWEDSFSPKQQDTIQRWLTKIHRTIEQRYGHYPFKIDLYIHKAKWPNEPVPWANTDRNGQQAIHFHIDPSASLDEFLADWTAPHEFAHLIIPYVGRSNRWFSEGFASYLQYKIMVDLKVISEEQKWRKYATRFQKAYKNHTYATLPFARSAQYLADKKDYPTMYWGGAIYFLQVEEQLMREGKRSFDHTLAKYLRCCRNNTRGIENLLSRLDAISESTTFQNTKITFEKDPGFPNFQRQLDHLSKRHQ